MAGNQQFCLRWNNHQSTLVSVFDSLLESGTLVDCTLAAEGQYLKAHKVVLSACSPYLEALLSQHYEKHPIIILKDVTFTELKAMLDYMYRGEVNISQDQLGTFLKAAESLHIKGLTDNSGSGDGIGKRVETHRKAFNPPVPKSPAFPQGLIVEPRPYKFGANSTTNDSGNGGGSAPPPPRDGSLSPKRAKRRRSCDDVKSEPEYTDSMPPSIVHCSLSENASPVDAESLVKPEPKLDEMNNDDSAEDKQYEDDEDDDMETSKPGTSQGSNSHPPGVWNASAEVSAEESFTPGGFQEQEGGDCCPKLLSRPLVASLKAVNTYMARLNTTVTVPQQRSSIQCPTCHKCYSSQHTLRRHMRLECGKEPQFHCPYCPRKTKQRYNLMLHIARAHKPDHTLQYNN